MSCQHYGYDTIDPTARCTGMTQNPALLPLEEFMRLAGIARDEGQHDLALTYFNAAWNLNRHDDLVAIEVAKALRATGQTGAAISLLRNLLEQPDNRSAAVAHHQLAVLLSTLGEYDEALVQAGLALELRPRNASAIQLFIAAQHFTLESFDAARSVLDGLVKSRPRWDRPYRLLARVAKATGQQQESLGYLRTVLQLNPQDQNVMLALVRELREAGQLEEASGLLDQHETVSGNSAAFWYQRGLLARYQDDAEQAVRYFSQGVAVESADHRCHHGWIEECLSLGYLDDAEAALDGAMNVLGITPDLERFQILVDRSRGRFGNVLRSAQDSLALNPDNFPLRCTLIEMQIRLAMFTEAEGNLLALTGDTPMQHRKKLILLAHLERARYQIDRALEYQSAVLAMPPEDGHLYRFMASLLLMQGDTRQAGVHLKTAEKLLARHGSKRSSKWAKGGLWYDIWREMRTNQFAEAGLMAARRLSYIEQVRAIAGILEQEPDHAGAAIALLVLLRQTDAFEQAKLNPPEPVDGVPKHIVQFWDSKAIPPDILEITQSWQAHNPGHQHTIFNDQSAEAFIGAAFGEDELQAFRMAAHPALRADLFRLAWLFVNGGIYADADDLCTAPVDQWLPSCASLTLLQEDIGSIGNNFMAATPGQPLLQRTLQRVTRNILERQGDCVWFISGPGALTQSFCSLYLEQLADRCLPDGLMVLDRYHVERYISMHLPRRYKQTEQHWSYLGETSPELFRRPPR